MRQLAHVATAILHDVDLVAVMNRLYRWKRNTDFCPQAGKNDLFLSRFLDRSHEILVVPGIHGGAFDGCLVWVDGLELRPHVPAKAFRFDSGEHYGNLKHSGRFCQCHDIVNDSLTIEVADSEQHLWFIIDQRHNAIVRSQKSLFTELGTISSCCLLTHTISPFCV